MRYNAGMCSSRINRGVGRINRNWVNASAQFRQLRSNLVARLIVASVAIVLLSLLAANAAALLILHDEFDRHADNALRQGERAALLVLDERANALDALVTVLAQRPTLQRLLAAQDIATLTRFLEDFRTQSAIDWLVMCRQAALLLATANAPRTAALCNSATATGYHLAGGEPVLMARTPVGEQDQLEIVAGQALDADSLRALTAASALEHSVVDPAARRLVSTWTTEKIIPNIVLDEGGQGQGRRRVSEAADGAFAVAFTAMRQAAPASLWLESALPISARLSAERRVVALLALSMAISAVVLIGVAVLGVRRANRSVTAALRRSEEAVASAQVERMAALEWLDTLIQSIVEGVIMADDAGVVRFVSVGAARILETAPDAATGAALNTLMALTDGGAFPLAALLAQPGHNRMLEVHTRSGKAVTVAVSATHIQPPNAPGRLNAFILRDVTEEEAHNRLRSYFLSSISHEFRTPTQHLEGFARIAGQRGEPARPGRIAPSAASGLPQRGRVADADRQPAHQQHD